jgi:hypothetical protein
MMIGPTDGQPDPAAGRRGEEGRTLLPLDDCRQSEAPPDPASAEHTFESEGAGSLHYSGARDSLLGGATLEAMWDSENRHDIATPAAVVEIREPASRWRSWARRAASRLGGAAGLSSARRRKRARTWPDKNDSGRPRPSTLSPA